MRFRAPSALAWRAALTEHVFEACCNGQECWWHASVRCGRAPADLRLPADAWDSACVGRPEKVALHGELTGSM